MRLATLFLVLPSLVVACSTLSEDPPAPLQPSALGTGARIADVQNPDSANYKAAIANPTAGSEVDISSAVVSWIDTFDETRDGKSVGTVYIQDVGSTAPYAGISVYEASLVPASLRLLPGDVLDFVGPYQELTAVGSAMFAPDTLPQLNKPVGTFDYEFQTPNPVTIQLSDIDQQNYATGRKWEGMLVTVEDITVAGPAPPPGMPATRVTYLMGQGDAAIDNEAAEISNELYNLTNNDFPAGTHFKSVTGIVTWFYSYHIAPRSAADLQQ
jgi:hypothetical protein